MSAFLVALAFGLVWTTAGGCTLGRRWNWEQSASHASARRLWCHDWKATVRSMAWDGLLHMHPPAVVGAMTERLRSSRWRGMVCFRCIRPPSVVPWLEGYGAMTPWRKGLPSGVVRAEGLFVVAYGVAAVVDGDIPDFAAKVFAFGAGYIESDYIVSVVLGVLMHGVLFGRGGAVAEIPFP